MKGAATLQPSNIRGEAHRNNSILRPSTPQPFPFILHPSSTILHPPCVIHGAHGVFTGLTGSRGRACWSSRDALQRIHGAKPHAEVAFGAARADLDEALEEIDAVVGADAHAAAAIHAALLQEVRHLDDEAGSPENGCPSLGTPAWATMCRTPWLPVQMPMHRYFAGVH